MKNFRRILATFFMLFCLNGFTQNSALIDTNYIWCNHFSCCGGSTEYAYRLKIGAPVATGTYGYSTVYWSLNNHPDDWWVRGYIREDSNRRVWLSTDSKTGGNLLYDFNIQAGDTLGYLICDSVGTQFLDQMNRQCIYLHHMYYPGVPLFNEIWVEGLLNLRCTFLQPGNSTMVSTDWVTCIMTNDSAVYGNDSLCTVIYPNAQFNGWTMTSKSDWYYNYYEENPYSPGEPNEGYIFIRASYPIIHAGKMCKKMLCSVYDHSGQIIRNVTFYTCYEDNKVLYTFNTTFSVLYDFSAKAGDSWVIRNPYEIYGLPVQADSMSVITVDSSVMEWSGMTVGMVHLYTHSSTPWRFMSDNTPKTGGNGFMFPGQWDNWSLPLAGSLREFGFGMSCYFDSYNYNPPVPGACTILVTNIDEPENHSDFSVFQQNGDANLSVRTLKTNGFSGIASLFDLQGRMLFRAEYSNTQTFTIPMENKAPGLYFIRLQEDRSVITTLKVVYTDY
jgi:hypothetical protein